MIRRHTVNAFKADDSATLFDGNGRKSVTLVKRNVKLTFESSAPPCALLAFADNDKRSYQQEFGCIFINLESFSTVRFSILYSGCSTEEQTVMVNRNYDELRTFLFKVVKRLMFQRVSAEPNLATALEIYKIAKRVLLDVFPRPL